MQIRLSLIILLFISSCASKPPCKGLTHNCENGDGGACFELGKAVFGTLSADNPNPEKTKDKAAEWMSKGCKLGHQQSCTEYANFEKYIFNGRK
ncbi:MAG: TPR repeat protein [Bacteriovoracaceae bacterium]|jgi:TPR repeat protein